MSVSQTKKLILLEGFRALPIKDWLVDELTPYGWITLTIRALPKVLEYNPYFSAYYVSEVAIWSKKEVEILSKYLVQLFGRHIPESVLKENLSPYYQDQNEIDIIRLKGVKSDIDRKEIFKFLEA